MTDNKLRINQILKLRILLMALFVISAVIYFPWRLTVFNPNAPVFATLFYFVEVLGFAWGIVFLLSVLKLAEPQTLAAPEGLSVDVFIPTYNEPVEIVRRTVVAAMRIRYPHETWLLDDGNRAVMRELAAELGCRYIARTSNTHAKAGNLNNAMTQSTGEFILMLDADFLAAPDFLDRTLGYFADPKVAFVQTPQEYYNYDSFQHFGRNRENDAWSEHSLFYRVIQPGRATYNAAMFCGCCAVMRRAAINSVGGIATGTVTEDMHTSVRLHEKGWKSIYHSETLSVGLAPHDALSFRRQRLRWAQGAMQVHRQEKLLFGSKGLSIFQRMAYIMHVMAHMEGLRHTFIYLVPILTLAFGLSPFNHHLQFGTWALYSMPCIVLGIFCFEDFSRGHGRILVNEMYNLARCPSSMRSMLALFDTRHIAFWVTPKIKSQSGFVFPWIILSLTIAAMAKVSWDVAHHTAALTGWPLMIIMLWASLSAAMAIGVCLLTRRCKVNRRSFSRFPVSLPVTLVSEKNKQQSFACRVTALSDGGLSIEGPADMPQGVFAGTLHIEGQDVPFKISLEARHTGTYGGMLIWENAAQKDNYEYLIILNRMRWLATYDDVSLKTFLGPVLAVWDRVAGKKSFTPAADATCDKLNTL